jgi:hypothetical protein
MARKHFTPEQIIHKLREAEVLISQGMTVPEAAHSFEPRTMPNGWRLS